MGELQGQMGEGVLGLPVRHEIGLARIGAESNARGREDAGLEGRLPQRTKERLHVERGLEVRRVLQYEMRHQPATGNSAFTWPVPELGKYGVTMSTFP